MKLYNFTDCKPIGEYSIHDINLLEQAHRIKLKKSGFEDIEKWQNAYKGNDNQIKFIKGHIRWSRYGSKKNYLMREEDLKSYFRIVGLFAYHAPEAVLPLKYRAILQTYAQCGSLTEAIKANNSTITVGSLYKFLERHHNDILAFVNKEFEDENE